MSTAERKELHDLVDALPDDEIGAAKKLLESLRDQGDPFAEMDPEHRRRLHEALDQSEREFEAGLAVPVEDVLKDLRTR